MYATYTSLIICPCLLIQWYYIIKWKRKINIDLEGKGNSWHPYSKNFFIVYHMGLLGCLYCFLYPLILPSTFYFLQSSVNLLHHFSYSIFLLFLFYTCSSLFPSSLGIDSCYILKIGFSSTVSSFSPFTSNILYYIFYFPICKVILLYIFQIVLLCSSDTLWQVATTDMQPVAYLSMTFINSNPG